MDKVTITETTLIWGLSCITALSMLQAVMFYSLLKMVLTGKGILKGVWSVKRVTDAGKHQVRETRSALVTPFGEPTSAKRS